MKTGQMTNFWEPSVLLMPYGASSILCLGLCGNADAVAGRTGLGESRCSAVSLQNNVDAKQANVCRNGVRF